MKKLFLSETARNSFFSIHSLKMFDPFGESLPTFQTYGPYTSVHFAFRDADAELNTDSRFQSGYGSKEAVPLLQASHGHF